MKISACCHAVEVRLNYLYLGPYRSSIVVEVRTNSVSLSTGDDQKFGIGGGVWDGPFMPTHLPIIDVIKGTNDKCMEIHADTGAAHLNVCQHGE